MQIYAFVVKNFTGNYKNNWKLENNGKIGFRRGLYFSLKN